MSTNIYADRDHEAQGEHYLRHIDRMTTEGLHSKSAIAGELAHRDAEIEALKAGRGHLIQLAAWLLSPEPTRPFDTLEENTHIGRRQFAFAQNATYEILRLKAIEVRGLADALT